MKSVLMIAYGFPPEGNAGSYRPLRFVRYLRPLGWQPTVITLDTNFFERYDPSLLSLVPNEIELIRVRNRDPWQAFQARRSRRIQKQLTEGSTEQATHILSAQQNPMRSHARELVRSIEARVYHPDIAMGWIAPAVRAIQQCCKRTRPDVIWATAGPVSSFHVAAKASRRTRIPYVLDFRDAWTVIPTEFDARRPKWLRRADQRAMFRLLKNAQAVIFRYDTEVECFWRAYPGALDISRIHIIPNGYEGTIDEFIPPRTDRLKIVYTGTLPDYRYDTLLQALCFLKQHSADLASRLHFDFVGEGTEALRDDAAVFGLADIITTSGPTSYDHVAQLSHEAHALLVLGRPSTVKGYELFAAAKLFGYLKAGRPIVGILPQDEANKILHRVGVSTVAAVDSVPDIAALLRKLVYCWADRTLPSLIPNPEACRIYSIEYQMHALVRALEGTPAADPFVPGLVKVPASLQDEISDRQPKNPFTSKAKRPIAPDPEESVHATGGRG